MRLDLLQYPARLVFISGESPTDLIIKAASGFSPVSHVAIGVGPEGRWLLHAIEEGVRLDHREEYLTSADARIHSEYEILHDVRDRLDRGFSLIGAPYDWREIALRVAAVVVPVLQCRSIWPIRYEAWTCARFVLHVLRPVIPEWSDLPVWVMPHDLLVRTSGPSFVSIAGSR